MGNDIGQTSAPRFTVRKTLPNLWEIHDRRQFQTEWVLFADRGIGHARHFVTDEFLAHNPEARTWSLQELAREARRAGVHHSFVAPPFMAPVGPLDYRP